MRGIFLSSLLVFTAFPPLHAAPINIVAAAIHTADLEINGGVIPADIEIGAGFPTALTGTVASALDDVAGAQADDVFTQIGNLFTDPPTPFITTRFDETALPNGDAARGFYYVESTGTPDANAGQNAAAFDRLLNGTATLDFANLDVDASASSDFELGRRLTLINTSNTTSYVFSISVGFDIALTASADAAGSESVAETAFSVSFISTGSVLLSGGLPIGDSTTIDDADLGTTVIENLVTSNALFDGVLYEGSVAATGVGVPTEASLEAQSRFLFDAQMDPRSTLSLNFFQSHDTRTEFVASPQVSVPVPGVLWLLASGLLYPGLCGIVSRRQGVKDAAIASLARLTTGRPIQR